MADMRRHGSDVEAKAAAEEVREEAREEVEKYLGAVRRPAAADAAVDAERARGVAPAAAAAATDEHEDAKIDAEVGDPTEGRLAAACAAESRPWLGAARLLLGPKLGARAAARMLLLARVDSRLSEDDAVRLSQCWSE